MDHSHLGHLHLGSETPEDFTADYYIRLHRDIGLIGPPYTHGHYGHGHVPDSGIHYHTQSSIVEQQPTQQPTSIHPPVAM